MVVPRFCGPSRALGRALQSPSGSVTRGFRTSARLRQQAPVELNNGQGSQQGILVDPEQTTNVEYQGRLDLFNKYFLRDSCKCSRCLDGSTQQKLFQTSDIPLDIDIQESQEYVNDAGKKTHRIQWKNDVPGYEDHTTEIPAESLWAIVGQRKSHQKKYAGSSHDRVLWDKSGMENDVLWIEYEDYVTSSKATLEALRHLHSHGLVFLRHVPDDETSVVKICERIGPLRDSFYGRTWNVKSVPDAKNIAYTNQFLGLHMDLLYMTNPPHLQFLHSLRAGASGGESLFADAFRAAEVIRKEDADMFYSLTTLPVHYHYKNDSQHYQTQRTTIELDLSGIEGGHGGSTPRPKEFKDTRKRYPARAIHKESRLKRVNWSPPFQAPFLRGMYNDKHTVSVMTWYLKAAKRFSDLVNAQENVFEYRLQEGDCVLFDNRRVLHARKAFDVTAGERWLKGAYVDDDVFYSRLRALEEEAKSEG